MLDVAISQITTPRWELSRELDRVVAHGFTKLSLWRPKLSDTTPGVAADAFRKAGVTAASLHGTGGFTGGGGRSFAESVTDAIEAIEAAATLGGGQPPPVVVLHSGCRAGHTRSHARRLVLDALATLAPLARREGVVLAVQPLRAAAAPGCSFLSTLDEGLDVVEACGDPSVRLAVDLWHHGDDPFVTGLLPRLAAATVLLQIADRQGPPTAAADRLPAGHGMLPLERLVAGFVDHGFSGPIVFDPVGEVVEVLGYDGVLDDVRLVADAWSVRLRRREAEACRLGAEFGPTVAAMRPDHYRRAAAGAGSRKSQASSQAASRG